jgi:uncharacterized membrane protein HdeD (DUF308 family)
MNDRKHDLPQSSSDSHWLKRYYFSRAAFSVVWVAAAIAASKNAAALIPLLLLLYPAWDALANLMDARRNGGMRRNPTQAMNAVASTITTIAVGIALDVDMNAVFVVFGVWAALSGAFQLATAVRRRSVAGGQWAMMLSGAQSVLAGAFFIKQATEPVAPSIVGIAPYAAFGAFYFLVSALWLTVSDARRNKLRLQKSSLA